MAVVACFVASATNFELHARNVEEPVVTLAGTMLPAVTRLAAVRTDLHAIETLVDEASEGHAWGAGSLQRARSSLVHDWGTYLGGIDGTLPERERAKRLLRDAESLVDEVRRQLLREDIHAAREVIATRLKPAFAEADGALDQLAASHVHASEQLLRRVQAERRRASDIALLWSALSVALAVLLGGLVVRGVRQHARLLEARAHELEQFADRVAHDVRGPLTPVLFALQLGSRESSTNPSLSKAMDRGLRSVRVVESILSDLLAFARSGARPQPDSSASLQDAVGNVLAALKSLAETERVELVVDSFDDCLVACRPGVIASVVSNLVRNAILHMGESTPRRVSVHVHVGVHVRLEVVDTGPGIDEALAEVIFEPRVRGSRAGEGLGLGLATVRRLAEGHGGRVGVRSRLGAGATFWVTLPRRPVAVFSDDKTA